MTDQEYQKDLRDVLSRLKLNQAILNDPGYRKICDLAGKIQVVAFKELIL